MLDLSREGSVFVLRMRNGENRIEGVFLRDFGQALDEVERSAGDAALVTTGEGRFYSNGLDLAAFAKTPRAEVDRTMTDLHALFARLLAFPVPMVAALNGHAFAAGAMLALAHDFRVMRADRGYFCLPEIDLATGHPLTDGMYALIRARLERPVFHELIATGRRFTAQDAAERAIVDEACDEARVLPRALEIAEELAGKHRATLGALKRGLYGSALEALSHG